MNSLRYLSAVFFLLAGLAVIPSAGAKPPAKIVTDTFAVTYDAKVTFEHHKAHPEFNAEDNVRYQVHGRLPELTFVDGLLQTDRSAMLKTKVKGLVGSEVAQADGWSTSCSGTVIDVRGLVGIARVDGGISLLPALTAKPRGTCLDSTGERAPLFLDILWPGEGQVGAKTFPLTPRSIDVPKWSKPFRIVFEDEKCPNYEPELTIACSFVMTGRLTLTRVDREELVDGEVLLPALDPPRLNPQKTKATTTIECQSGCEVEAAIGVVGGSSKHPKVTPLHKQKLHLPGGKPTTIRLPVSAQDRAVAKQGVLVMTLQAKGGKEQVYPLAPAGLPDIAMAGKGVVRALAFPGRAVMKAGRVTVPVSNPNGFKARGSLELRLGRQRLGGAPLAIPAHGERKLTVKLDGAARRAVERRGPRRLSAIASFRDPAGRLRHTSGTVALTGTSGGGTPPPTSPTFPNGPTQPPVGADGTYHGSGGLTVVVAGGKVTVFSGQMTTYCTKTEEQKNVTFGMFGDDPVPEVAADGSFAYEATSGYGVVKLKYEGRVSGDTASGTLVVEDRSPISTSDGRLDFDYCCAGGDWSATR